jgi:DNA-binding MarR family transcriptional regulator
MNPIRLSEFLPYRLAVLSQRLSAALAAVYEQEHGLSAPQWRVMAAVAERPGRTAQEVVRMTPMEKATVSRAVSALIARGLLRREADDRDGRASRLALTDSGSEMYSRIAPAALAVEADIVAALERGGKTRLLQTITGIEAALGDAQLEAAE